MQINLKLVTTFVILGSLILIAAVSAQSLAVKAGIGSQWTETYVMTIILSPPLFPRTMQTGQIEPIINMTHNKIAIEKVVSGPSIGITSYQSAGRFTLHGSVDFYPYLRVNESSEVKQTFSAEPEPIEFSYTDSGRALGWGIDLFVGYKVFRGLGVEGGLRTLVVYGPSPRTLERDMNRMDFTVRGVYRLKR